MGDIGHEVGEKISKVIREVVPKIGKAISEVQESYSVVLVKAAKEFKAADEGHVLQMPHTGVPAKPSPNGADGWRGQPRDAHGRFVKRNGGDGLSGKAQGLRDNSAATGMVRLGQEGEAAVRASKWTRTEVNDHRVTVAVETGPAAEAMAFQGRGAYPGTDAWQNTTLKAGTVVHAGEPGLTGFATSDAAASAVGHDAVALNQGLQIASRAGTYRPGLTAFRLTRDVQVARSFALANSQFGPGGLEQFFIPHLEDVSEPLVSRLMSGGAP